MFKKDVFINKKIYFYLTLSLIFLFGILLRLKGLLISPSMWHDECALAFNIKIKSYLDFFKILEFGQLAPPFFMILTKAITKIFGISDFTLRIIPFIVGCLSIIAFYFLSKKVLNRNYSIIFALLLFVVNQRLINYSFEFKPYGIDVFFTILCLLFFINIDMEKLNIKKALFYGLILSTFPWFSFVTIFTMASGFLNLLFTSIKSNLNKKIALILPLAISVLVYLNIYLLSHYNEPGVVNYWQKGFITANLLSLLYILAEGIRYLFFPIKYVLFSLILLIWGITLLYKEKSKFVKIAFTSLIFALISSFLHVYPFSDRLILFLIPIFLLLMIKPLDLISFDKRIKSSIIIFITLLTFCSQAISTLDFVKLKTISRGEYPREMMEFMVKNIKKEDTIFVNAASNPEFVYYSSFYNIKNKIIQENITNEPKEKYTLFLNKLKPGYYWFYLPYDSSHLPVFQNILLWAKTKKILYYYKADKSILMYLYLN